MNSIGQYFANSQEDAISIKENIIQGKKFRFTLLTDRLIRLEYNEKGTFEDRPTNRVIFRRFPKVNFTISQSEMIMQLTTSYFTVAYVKDKPFTSGKLAPGSNLKITLNNTEHSWYYGHPEARNFGGIPYSLDDFNGKLKLEKGLYSTDGFAILDDSHSYVIDTNGNFLKRESKAADIYVFMYRKDLGLCLKDYYTLTGYPMLIPRYALGTWWYKNESYTNKELEELLINFKEEDINISTILLGKNTLSKNDPLNIDGKKLNITSLKQTCNHYGVRLGLTTDPLLPIKEKSVTYQNLQNMGLNIKGDYSFLPIDNQKLNLYDSLGLKSWMNLGIDTINIDYNNIKDKDTLSLLNHHAYAMYGLLQNKRGTILTRNHDLSIHKDGVVFAGNTLVDWNTLAILPRYFQTASNNALSYIATPIGGYYGGVENFELYIRYIQLGVFSPMLILASDTGKYYKREPWRWNESQSEIIKKYLNLRNKLIPYIYTEDYIYSKSGSPLIQPLYYKYPKIYDEPNYRSQYFFGSVMLVCPIIKKKNSVMNRVVQRMFIPEGTWYELESGKKFLGNKYYTSFYKDEDYPVFVRQGSIIVMSLNNTTEIPNDLEIVVFPGNDGTYQLYEDDGISNNYKNGTFSVTNFTFKYQLNQYELTIQNAGNPGLIPPTRNYKIRFKNAKATNIVAQSGGINLSGKSYLEKNDLVVELPNVSTTNICTITVQSEGIIENSTERLINDDIKGILEDLEIETTLKEKIDAILFGTLPINKKRIAIRKLKRSKLEPKFIKIFLNLLEYIETV